MELVAGTRITDNIELVELLGEGGMARVWVAEHHGLRTRVAVKLLARALLDADPDMAARFVREATAAARIKSPHVVQILDQGVLPDGTPFIVMERLEGEDLHARLERVQRLDLRALRPIVQQVCKALSKAHAAGVVHRDIKPDNVFLVASDEDDEPLVKVLDFGVAKQSGVASCSVVTATGAMVGTPGYMSPEQVLSGKNVDARTDLWSLGVLVYRALAGDIPFEGETLGALCVSISRASFTPLSALREDLPEGIDAWMARALARDREDRFESARQMAEAFDRLFGERVPQPAADQAPVLVVRPPADLAGARAQPRVDAGTVVMAPEERPDEAPAPAGDAPSASIVLPMRRGLIVPAALLAVLVLAVVMWRRSGGEAASAPTAPSLDDSSPPASVRPEGSAPSLPAPSSTGAPPPSVTAVAAADGGSPVASGRPHTHQRVSGAARPVAARGAPAGASATAAAATAAPSKRDKDRGF